MLKKTIAAALLASSAFAMPAFAQTVVLDFDALNSAQNESPLDYYNGGAGSLGTTGGPNYGISFSSNTITGCTQPNACANTNSAGNPSGSNVIFFLSGGASTMNVAAGFTTGFSFYYSAVNVGGTVNVYDGLNGTGNVLASLVLPVTPSTPGDPACYGTSFCPYVAFGVTFAGTAMSVDFAGTDNQIGFDNITLGASTPGGGTVPEPATWGLMILGFGAVGGAMRRRSTKVAYTA